jgi:hypothetical protein
MKRVRFLAAFVTALTLASCLSSVTPHQNFIDHGNHNIGSSIDDPRVVGSTNQKNLLGSRTLPNGNVEHSYKWRGSCRKFFEYDPKTRIIVAFRWEGSEQDCEVVP